MAVGFDITDYRGEQPARAPELLTKGHAILAKNCKLRSGNLVPMRELEEVASTNFYIGSFYGLKGTSGLEWVAWSTQVGEVNVVAHPSGSVEDQRFYYSGDGSPKVSTYTLAQPQTGSSVNKPVQAYDLGLPLPSTKPVPELAQPGHVSVSSVSVTSDVATYTTTQPHGLSDGDKVTVRNVSDRKGTYSYTAGVITLTIPEHGLATGGSVPLVFETGPLPSGDFTVASVIDSSTFTVASSYSQTGSGNVRISMRAANVEHSPVTVVSPTSFTVSVGMPDIAANTTPLAKATALADIGVVSIERSADTVTYYTDAPHGFRTGAFVTVSGLKSLSGTMTVSGTVGTVTITNHGIPKGAKVPILVTSGSAQSQFYTVQDVTDADTFTVSVKSGLTGGSVEIPLDSLLAVNARVTRLGDTAFSVFLPGFPIHLGGSVLDGVSAFLSGQATIYNYVFTWVTPWGEESVGSEPSDDVHARYTERVHVSNLPSTPPAGNNFIRGIRLYRSVGTAGYLKLADLWFPAPVAKLSRSGGTARITTQYAHHLIVGDRVKLTGAVASNLGASEFTVTNVDGADTFEVASAGADISDASIGGTLYHDVAENKTLPAVYWGSSGFDFYDDFLVDSLTEPLQSSTFDPPPASLKGLTVAMNNMLAGFSGSSVYFSYPGEPHAWPPSGEISISDKVVAIALFGSSLFVATDAHPYVISGTTPRNLSVTRLDAVMPCVNAKSLVVSDLAVMYVSDDGIASFSQVTGLRMITHGVHDADTWEVVRAQGDPVAMVYEGRYIASMSGSFNFAFTPQQNAPGDWVQHTLGFQATWAEPSSASQFVATANKINQWDKLGAKPLMMEWQSGWIDTKKPVNLGAMVVDATFAHPVTVELYPRGRRPFVYTVDEYRLLRLTSGFKSDFYSLLVRSKGVVRSIKLADTPISLGGV